MRRELAIAICIAFTSVSSVASSGPQYRKPNIVLILADDLGYGDVGFNGRKDWPTRNLDRLARQGTVFSRWYVGGVTCAPSRAVLLTGKYSIHTGVIRNNDAFPSNEVTIAEALKSQGYTTALFGKWHHVLPSKLTPLLVHPMDKGFDVFYGFENAVHAWEHFPKELWNGRVKERVTGYADTIFANKSINYIHAHRTQPFFLYLPFNSPHFRIEAPEEDIKRFRGTFKEHDPNHPINATYAAMIYRQDLEIGRVLKALDESGQAKNTIVIFSSDHGATFEVATGGAPAYHDSNRPFRGQKRTVWEGGIRVSTVVRWPGHVPAGRVCDTPIHNIDMMPTLLSAAGSTPRPGWHVDGQDMLSVWAGGSKPARDLFWEWRQDGAFQLATMRDNMKLIVTGFSGPSELYDVVLDPGERRNRVAELPLVARSMRKELMRWMRTDQFPLAAPQFFMPNTAPPARNPIFKR